MPQKSRINNIGSFHKGCLDSLRRLKLNKILERKNPHLFKARNILLAQDLVRILIDAYLTVCFFDGGTLANDDFDLSSFYR